MRGGKSVPIMRVDMRSLRKIQSVEGERGSHAVVLGLYLVVFVRLGQRGESKLVSWANDTSSSIKAIELETK